MTHPHLMNAADLGELEQRFADDRYARPPADPSPPRRSVAGLTSCTPAEFRALELATRQEFLVKLDRWRNQDQRIEGNLRQP
jgi:hypothetical protein